MKKILLFISFLLFCSSISQAEVITPHYPNAVYQIVIKKDKGPDYKALAKKIGFEIWAKYSYTEYADIKWKNKMGSAGNYEFLFLSTGGTEWNEADLQKFNKQSCGWETTYYSNHNLTVIHEVCNDRAESKSWVKILKLAKGRRPNLYKE